MMCAGMCEVQGRVFCLLYMFFDSSITSHTKHHVCIHTKHHSYTHHTHIIHTGYEALFVEERALLAVGPSVREIADSDDVTDDDDDGCCEATYNNNNNNNNNNNKHNNNNDDDNNNNGDVHVTVQCSSRRPSCTVRYLVLCCL